MAVPPSDPILRLLQELRAEQRVQTTMLLALTEAMRRVDRRIDDIDQKVEKRPEQAEAPKAT